MSRSQRRGRVLYTPLSRVLLHPSTRLSFREVKGPSRDFRELLGRATRVSTRPSTT